MSIGDRNVSCLLYSIISWWEYKAYRDENMYSLGEFCSMYKLNKIYEKQAFGFAPYRLLPHRGFVYSPSVRTAFDLHNARKMNSRSTWWKDSEEERGRIWFMRNGRARWRWVIELIIGFTLSLNSKRVSLVETMWITPSNDFASFRLEIWGRRPPK